MSRSSEPTCKLEFFIILWSFPRVGPIFLGLELTTPSSNWHETSQTFAQFQNKVLMVSSLLWKSYRTPQSKCRPVSLPMSGSYCAWLLDSRCLQLYLDIYDGVWLLQIASVLISWFMIAMKVDKVLCYNSKIGHGVWFLENAQGLGDDAKIFLENMSINGKKERSSTYGASYDSIFTLDGMWLGLSILIGMQTIYTSCTASHV